MLKQTNTFVAALIKYYNYKTNDKYDWILLTVL